jgi:Transcriptional repressor TCF25
MQLNEIEDSEEEETVELPEKPAVSTKLTSSPSTPSKKSKSKKKRRKQIKDDGTTSSTPSERPSTPTPSNLDDIDRAIQEISQKYGDTPSPSSSSTTNHTLSQTYSLLSVNPKHLDADLELRKLFGKIVDAEARESRRQPIHGIPVRVINRIKASQAQRKRTLMKPKDEWQLFSAYNKRMLSMDVIEKVSGVTKFKFVHSRRYQDIQMRFFITALGGDGNVLMELLRENPFHVDTWYPFSDFLLTISVTVSELLKHQGSLSEAADLIGMKISRRFTYG